MRADIEAAKALFEETVAQRVSYPVMIWRAVRVLHGHLQSVSAVAERDAL